MKTKDYIDELYNLAKQLDITIRKDSGNFGGGLCVVNKKKFIILNRTLTPEMTMNLIAKCLSNLPVEDVYMKPAVRTLLNKELIEADPENLIVNITY
jgi:hypothetical protein